jgi:hypothetical protein
MHSFHVATQVAGISTQLTFLHTCKDTRVQANMGGCHNKALHAQGSKLD